MIPMDPLAALVLENEAARRAISGRKRGAKKGAPRRPNGKASSSEFHNRLDVRLKLHVCDSVKQFLYGETTMKRLTPLGYGHEEITPAQIKWAKENMPNSGIPTSDKPSIRAVMWVIAVLALANVGVLVYVWRHF